ncbi:MAG: endonuclease/exonuclease/phosphatase family protein [Actinomycetota bacterium]|nr:endonuclease/exonuclease/phosphatase family protein [Actinomycetota bacterium]
MPIATSPQFGPPPKEIAYELAHLSDALDETISPKELDRNLIIATWNIRELGNLTKKWATAKGDSPKRNLADAHYIAEILSRFDVVAVQEVQNNLEALRLVMGLLGTDFGFHITDINSGDAGDDERLAYVYDLRRVAPSGLAGELVLSEDDLGSDGGLDRQLVKTPYVMSFRTAGRPFVLATVHIIWGKDKDLQRRAEEVEALAKMVKRLAKPASDDAGVEFRSNVIVLGDKNVTSVDDPIYKAMIENGLQPDVDTLEKPRTVSDRKRPGQAIAYDQLAWIAAPPGKAAPPGALEFRRRKGDTFPWDAYVLQEAEGDTTFRMSDHYPLWVEFSVRESIWGGDG